MIKHKEVMPYDKQQKSAQPTNTRKQPIFTATRTQPSSVVSVV